MTISINDVEHISQLAKFSLTQTEKETIVTHLNEILEFAKKIDDIDTTHVLPTVIVPSFGNTTKTPLRKDTIIPSIEQQIIFQTAPDIDQDHLRVPQMIED